MHPTVRMVKPSADVLLAINAHIGPDYKIDSASEPVFRHLPGLLVEGPYRHLGGERFTPVYAPAVISTKGPLLERFDDSGEGLEVLCEVPTTPEEAERTKRHAQGIHRTFTGYWEG